MALTEKSQVVLSDQQGPVSASRQAIVDAYLLAEDAVVANLLEQLSFWGHELIHQSRARAYAMVEQVREAQSKMGGINAFMHHYDLSSEEGILLMCMAEALLRIPDQPTEDKLIKDKLLAADWAQHKGSSDSSFVNLATLGLVFTGKVLDDSTQSSYLNSIWKRLVRRSGEPVIRYAIRDAMRILSEQFVLGQSIEEALQRSKPAMEQGYRYSYDMLGEVARTQADADRYFKAYVDAIHCLGSQSKTAGIADANSISVKLSALHPRYEFAHHKQAVPALIERLGDLANMAQEAGISLTVDAEEADRLDMCLDIVEAVFLLPTLKGWDGFGLAVQAYQKRAPAVIDYLIDLAKRQKKRIQVRLVKGAYWDTEIKLAQELGSESYPVYTRKQSTDANYIACANKMLQAPKSIYAQFATHNAHTVAAVLALTEKHQVSVFEFQNLQGMGKSLHDALVKEGIPSRIYAPVGTHEALLPYLVRRLLENGANCSFVNRIVDSNYSIDDLVADPVEQLRAFDDKANPKIVRPPFIYAHDRKNARGFNMADWNQLSAFREDLLAALQLQCCAPAFQEGALEDIEDPAHLDVVGRVHFASPQQASQAFEQAQAAFSNWSCQPLTERAAILNRMADLLESHMPRLVYLIVREAGRVVMDAIEDVREAIDFCRYYALEGQQSLAPMSLQGVTGESNGLSYRGRGVMICISPWNFPAAIFTGQVAAALMAGNTVLAKPAEQTPLTACAISELFVEAGLPSGVLHCLPGDGELGAFLVAELPHAGVVFTGSNTAAWSIQKSLASQQRAIVPLIAETGGINVMLADSSALPEQLVHDVIQSAFGSAGQRCSALRVLYVQKDIAHGVFDMLAGAMALLKVGDPLLLSTDIGPVIDAEAKAQLQSHIDYLQENAECIATTPLDPELEGYYVAPQAYLLKHLSQLKREVFGPILHVLVYESSELDQVIDDINGLGYGLTFGVQTRIDELVEELCQKIRVGNIYVNRSTVGAVVGVQPFGGSGLSGTGPKAGGPNTLKRLSTEVSVSINTTASGGNAALMSLED